MFSEINQAQKDNYYLVLLRSGILESKLRNSRMVVTTLLGGLEVGKMKTHWSKSTDVQILVKF